MPRPSHKERILDIAQESILAKGFDATSIDEIVAAADITRSGFFYHFADKNALALALIDRHVAFEDQLFDSLFERAAELSDDPLHRALIGMKLLAELLEDMESGHPGCIVATAAYQDSVATRARPHGIRLPLRWMARISSISWKISRPIEQARAG